MVEYKVIDSVKLEAELTEVADAIRAKTGGTEQLSFPEGIVQELDEVFEAGKSAEYNEFWDAFQDYGKRTHYYDAFSGIGWNDQTFRPKYNIVPYGAQGMLFAYARITDLVKILKEQNVTLDLSNVTYFSQLITDSTITRLPIINTCNANKLDNILFGALRLESVEKVILREDGSQTTNANMFYACTELKDIIFDGVLGGSIDLQWSTKLSKGSIQSIVNALCTTVSSITVTLSQKAINTAFETTLGAADGSTSQEWLELIATKPNWTISLV